MSLSDGNSRPGISSIEQQNIYSAPADYYSGEEPIRKLLGVQTRAAATYLKQSSNLDRERKRQGQLPTRRSSNDEYGKQSQIFVVYVDETLKELEEREDSDRNHQITIDDNGPKNILLGTLASAGYKSTDIHGNYLISNLYQELTLAKDLGQKIVKLHRARLNENPVDRLARRIKDEFWKNLERVLDASVIEKAGLDPKDWTGENRPRIYIPSGCPEQYGYYTKAAEERPEMNLDVQWLPKGELTPQYVRSLNNKPGILALAMKKVVIDGKETLKGEPFVVPGGRFNELYGWDSYMESVGLIVNGRVEMAESMVNNFVFCIQHYGKILNANRSYYLARSQPPFLTDMTLKVYANIQHKDHALEFLRQATLAAIKEYYNVWMSAPRLDPVSNLSRYRPDGLGVPPETEASHFVHVLKKYHEKHGMTFEEFVKAYNSDEVNEPELDEYFLHDRGVRESGHDTSYRLEGKAANLATVDLNSLLYKYEKDIAFIVRSFFKDRLAVPADFRATCPRMAAVESSALWDGYARKRKVRMDKFMWNEERGMFFDYDTIKKTRTAYESATTFWTMWARVASPKQAAALVAQALPKFEMYGGLVSGTEASRGKISLSRPNRQWDYPYGWAPQQMLAWGGLINYGYEDDAQRIAYKWIHMVTKAFVDFNGVVVEKYNVTTEMDAHKVEAEYGNQGADFKGVPREGFGWVNASYVYALSFLPIRMKRALGTLTPWATFEKMTRERLDDLDKLTIEEGSDESAEAEEEGAVPEHKAAAEVEKVKN